MLYEEGFTQNRELSWLRYNERVLEEALDETVPPFERLRFISIFDSNLEEFFRVRVGSLLFDDGEGNDDKDERSGMTAADQLVRIHSMVPGFLMKKDVALSLVESILAEAGVERLDTELLTEEERGRCFDFFRDELKPGLRIRLLSKEDKFPKIDENRPYMIADLDAELEDRFGLIDIPAGLPSIFVLDSGEEEGSRMRYVLSEDIIKLFADMLFIPFLPVAVYTIDIARNTEASGGTDRANTAGEMKKAVKKRQNAPADKLIADGTFSKNLREFLEDRLGLDKRQIFSTTRIDFSYIEELEEAIPERLREGLFFEPHVPYDQTADIDGSIIEEVKKRDLLSAYPQDSMDLFLELLSDAAFTASAKEIRITIYRLASNPKIADYLIAAAHAGKKVRVVLELRARFDEESNLRWAEKLTEAGCKVYYGTEEYKVHSKLCQIILEDENRKKSYITHISTGNFNEKTAKLYTDLSLITYDQDIGKAASRLFKDICKERIGTDSQYGERYMPLLAAPVNMRNTLEKLIKKEAAKGTEGKIFIKVNSLTDQRIMEALMEASCCGCQIRMIVRGICCLLPGIDSCTETISIVNRVGRFLEHSRVYVFGSGKEEMMYISSADLMPRNLDRRVEIACPVYDSALRRRIRSILKEAYSDRDKGRVLLSDGTYARKGEKKRPEFLVEEDI